MVEIAETREPQAPVRENEHGELILSLEQFRKRPRWLELENVSGEIVTVKIPGSLSLAKMIEFWQIEDQLVSDTMTDERAVPLLRDLEVEIGEIIAKHNPGVEIELELDPRQAVALFGFLARPNDSLASLFANALREGSTGGEKQDTANDAEAGVGAGAGDEGAETAAPLRSGKRSSGRSSASEKSTAGRPSGGSSRAARSRRSAPTSRTRGARKPPADGTT